MRDTGSRAARRRDMAAKRFEPAGAAAAARARPASAPPDRPSAAAMQPAHIAAGTLDAGAAQLGGAAAQAPSRSVCGGEPGRWRQALASCSIAASWLGLIVGDQGVDQLVERRAFQHLVELVQGEADAVVGDAPLREIVGADALRTVAGADLAACAGRPAHRRPSRRSCS